MKALMIAMFAAASFAPAMAQAPQVALGLTHEQLDDADLLDSNGREIGEVERVVMGADGKVTGLIVEIDQRDPTPDRRVQISLAGLKAVPERGDADDFNIQTTQTRAALLALPMVQ